MAKTDKELTIELVNNYVNSWNASDKTKPLQADYLLDFIPKVYDLISKLDQSSEEENAK